MSERKVTDLHMASWLVIRGHPLVRMDRNVGRVVFIFTETPALEHDAITFLSRKGLVEPLAYAEQIRTLKGAAR